MFRPQGYQQSFHTAGCAGSREAIGAEILAQADEAELPTFEILGRLIRMQALCALDDIAAAAEEARRIDSWATALDRPLASVFTAWFRHSFAQGPLPAAGAEMSGFRTGLNALVDLTAAVRTGAPLPDGDFGPYEPWVRPPLPSQAENIEDAKQALDNFPTPPNDLMLEVSWFLIALAALGTGHLGAARQSCQALLPAAAERAAGSGVVDMGQISPLLSRLTKFITHHV